VTMKNAPPGRKPHEIVHRVDGWIIDPEDETRIPSAVAELMAHAMPQLGEGNSIADIRARMIARHERMKRRRYE
jgi:hypothetical protein